MPNSKLGDRDLPVLAVVIGVLVGLAGVWLAITCAPRGLAAVALGLMAGASIWKIPPKKVWGRTAAVGLFLAWFIALGLGRVGLVFSLEFAAAYIVLSRGGYTG